MKTLIAACSYLFKMSFYGESLGKKLKPLKMKKIKCHKCFTVWNMCLANNFQVLFLHCLYIHKVNKTTKWWFMHGNFLGSNCYAKNPLFTDCRQPYNNKWIFLLHEQINQCEAQMVNGEKRKHSVRSPLFLKEMSELYCCHWEVGLCSEM